MRRTGREEKDAAMEGRGEGGGLRKQRDAHEGDSNECFGVYLMHGAYTHCPFLHKVDRRGDAAVFRSNWIY